MPMHAFHNALFIAIFTNNKLLMTELLKFFLPRKMVGKLDFRTLKFEQTVFTDADGNERRADAIISVLSKKRKRALFLLEHKSSQDRGIFIQLLSYQTVLYDRELVTVIPIVIYTGKAQWRLPRRFRSVLAAIDGETCEDVVLDFGYYLLDLAAFDVETLKNIFPKSHPYLLALKCLQQPTREVVGEFFVSSRSLSKRERFRLVHFVAYGLIRSGIFSTKVLQKIEMEYVKSSRGRVMQRIKIGLEGWKEDGRQEGLKEGLKEGRQEGRQEGQRKLEETALRMLEEGMSIELICRMTGLTRADLARLRKKRA